jgi:hypothetical protein
LPRVFAAFVSIERDVIEVRSCNGKVFQGSHAGEGAEVVDKVGLIVVSAVEREVGQIGRGTVVEGAERALETADALENLGGKADLMMKDLDEPARTEANPIDDLAHAAGASEAANCEGDGGMKHERASELGQERVFEDGEERGNWPVLIRV